MTYAAAGHDAILVAANGCIRHLESTGTVLGLAAGATFVNGGTLSLNSGDVLLIATDGIAETLSPSRQLFGRDRIVEILRSVQSLSANEILQAICGAVEEFREREPQRDDVTAVVLKVL